MLYETLNQPKLLVIFLLVGFFCGIIFDLGNFVKFLFGNKKLPSFLLDFIQTSISLIIIFYVNLNYNYGQIRLFPFLVFLTTFSIERFTLAKIVAKFYLSCYNYIIKLNNKIWSKRKNDKTNKTN